MIKTSKTNKKISAQLLFNKMYICSDNNNGIKMNLQLKGIEGYY